MNDKEPRLQKTPDAKPAVLRCSRCGRFVDWEEARLQILCGCRGRLELPVVLAHEMTNDERANSVELLRRNLGPGDIVVFGEAVRLDETAMLIAEMKGEVAGALAYRLCPDAVRVVALVTDPMWQRSGVGGQLVAEIELLARQKGLERILVAVTNDNLPALYFYQRRGYTIVEVALGGMLRDATDPKTIGFAGIPMRDEIRLEKRLSV